MPKLGGNTILDCFAEVLIDCVSKQTSQGENGKSLNWAESFPQNLEAEIHPLKLMADQDPVGRILTS